MNAFEKFAKDNGILFTPRTIDRRTDRADEAEWDKTAFHFRCTLTKGASGVTVEYSKGAGHGRKTMSLESAGIPSRIVCPPPTVAEVLEALQSDYRDVIDADFEDWAAEYGMSPDSRKAEALFNRCRNGALAFRKLLGRTLFGAFLAIEAEDDQTTDEE